MTRDEAMKLLGRYAANSLTEDERKALFAAALDDQELFDALEHEQALKEVFDDRAARAEIRQALEPPLPPASPWWARPWAWGGAGAAVAALALLAIWLGTVHPKPPLEIAQTAKPLEQPAGPAANPQSAELKPPAPAKARVPDRAEAKSAKKELAAPAKDALAATEDRPQPAASAPRLPVAESPAAGRPAQNEVLKQDQSVQVQSAAAPIPTQSAGSLYQQEAAPGSRSMLAARKSAALLTLSYSLLRRDSAQRDVAVLPAAVRDSDAVRITLQAPYAGVLTVLLVRNGVSAPLRPPLDVTPGQTYVVPDVPVIVRPGDILQLTLHGAGAPANISIPLGKP